MTYGTPSNRAGLVLNPALLEGVHFLSFYLFFSLFFRKAGLKKGVLNAQRDAGAVRSLHPAAAGKFQPEFGLCAHPLKKNAYGTPSNRAGLVLNPALLGLLQKSALMISDS